MKLSRKSMRPLWAILAALACGLLTGTPLEAVDMGVMLDQTVTLDDAFSGNMENSVGYTGNLNPWLSAMLVENGDLYLSAAVGPRYEGGEFFFIAELLRAEIVLRNSRGGTFRLGRMFWSDPLGFVASGVFDGAEFTRDLGGGLLSTGFWYTGLQYKKSANITVSPQDRVTYHTVYDPDDMGTYFGSRRLLAALSWDHPALAEKLRLRLAAIGQFDLNGESDKYHSEYFVARATMPIRNTFVFDAGGTLELLQTPSSDYVLGLAAELGAAWMPPTVINDRLSLIARYASGRVEDSPLESFMPLTTMTQGSVLKAKLSGLAHFRAGYTARLHETFSADLGASYFLLTSKDGRAIMPAGIMATPDNAEKYALGADFFTSLVWSPVSDIRANFGAGLFLPQLGDIAPSGRSRWLFQTGFSVALY